MTLAQGLSFSIVGMAVAFFAWGRFRYDVVALVALLVAVAVGVVPAKRAFSGFTSDVVVIIACALIISAAVAKSGVVEQVLQPVLARLKTPQTQVPALAGATAVLSMGTKNVGALAMLMPVAIRVARDTGTSRSSLLMPMSFMSLLGGLVTLVGTSTNIIVSQVREDFDKLTLDAFDWTMTTNVRCLLTAMQCQIKAMLQSGGGSIVNIASITSVVGVPNMAAYCASRHAMLGMTKSAALDYAQRNIRINAVAPGPTMTAQLKAGGAATPEGAERMRVCIPMGRFGEPKELVGSAIFLASEAASFVTGQIVAVDGGFLASGVNQ